MKKESIQARVRKIIDTMERVFFVVVDQYTEDANGELKVKRPIYRDHIFCINDRKRTDPRSGIEYPERCVKLVPSAATGVYDPVDTKTNPEDAERILSVMLTMVDDPTNPIIGPYPSFEEAVTAKNEERPLTPGEELRKLRVENAEMKQKVNVADGAEVTQMRQRIAELEAQGKKSAGA